MNNQNRITVHSLSNYFVSKMNVIYSEIQITNVFDVSKEIKSIGLWDTGATNSCITKEHAEQLGLHTISKATVSGVFGPQEANVYAVRVTLNNKSISVNVQVTECEALSADKKVGMLIGMDIISMGDFSISNHNNKTTMTFRVPSVATTDYVKLHNNISPNKSMSKTGRNEDCPCGSTKKYKNCCGRNK
ncbi:MAG: retroviral-like aspartic protease family protein [Bacteroidales bacterium]|nr:retroviral-like aspartic protease family protein [Bacteroidales bacterium]